jgi:hypothetical protein
VEGASFHQVLFFFSVPTFLSCGDVEATFALELVCELGKLATRFSVAELPSPVATLETVELLIKRWN